MTTWDEAARQAEREMPNASLKAKEDRAMEIFNNDNPLVSSPESAKNRVSIPNYELHCGHKVYWYGEDQPEGKKFAPPATLWCSECKSRVRT